VRDDDRYLFLEALLSARDELYLSWIYRDVADNSVREPSVLVSELRDYLALRHPHTPVRSIEHPLQPFSVSLFDSDQPALHTFASEWAPPTQTPELVQLTETPLQAPAEGQVSLADLQRFWQQPVDWHCRRVLRVSLWRDEQEPEDAEPFALDALANYQLRGDLIEAMMAQPNIDQQAAHQWLNRRGVLPHGGLGALSFDAVFEEARELVERIHAHQLTLAPAIDIDLAIHDQQLQGRLQGGVNWPDGQTGLLHYHASNLHGSHVSAWWLCYLIGSAAGAFNGPSLLIGKDKERTLAAMAPADALLKLQPWIDGWNQGQATVVPFFGKTSAVLAGAVKGKVDSVWLPSMYGGPGECERESVQLLFDNVAELLSNPDVFDWAQRLLGDEALKP
jgi:exodeoxyribonuclease V gamma subunit